MREESIIERRMITERKRRKERGGKERKEKMRE
jgi:hypothetical protein